MVELRKRKAPANPAPPPPAKKRSNPVKSAVDKAKAALTGKKAGAANGSAASSGPTVGSSVDLSAFGGEIETHDGTKTTLAKLVEESKSGVVLFTYPKASTPGCTQQACLFRDDYTPLTATGFAIYGLSRDSGKANTTFKTKQNLPYSLLSDPSATLIDAIGMKKSASGTTRGVFVVDKQGKVLAAEAGGPAATVQAVKKLVVTEGETNAPPAPAEEKAEAPKEDAPAAASTADAPAVNASAANGELEKKQSVDHEKAEVAAEVADTAAKLDQTPQPA